MSWEQRESLGGLGPEVPPPRKPRAKPKLAKPAQILKKLAPKKPQHIKGLPPEVIQPNRQHSHGTAEKFDAIRRQVDAVVLVEDALFEAIRCLARELTDGSPQAMAMVMGVDLDRSIEQIKRRLKQWKIMNGVK